MLQRTGPGRFYARMKNGRGFLYLMNFDIEGIELKPVHKEALRKLAVPALLQGGSLTLLGMADPSGSPRLNEQISRGRWASVHRFLREQAGQQFKCLDTHGAGEMVARRAGLGPNASAMQFRAVLVVVSSDSEPRPVLPNEAPIPDLKGTPVLSDWGWTLDIAFGVLDLFSAFASGAAGALGAAGTAAGVGAGVGVVIWTNVGAAVYLNDVDKAAKLNGYIDGFAAGLQALATQYAPLDLGKLPPEKWPAPTKPNPQRTGFQLQGHHARLAQEGFKEGAEAAYRFIMHLERKPLAAKSKDGKQDYKITGRMMCRQLYLKHKQRVGEWAIEQINRLLKPKGIQYPIYTNRIGGARTR